jgi:hypothetical protein
VDDIRPRVPSSTARSAHLGVESTANAQKIAEQLPLRSEILAKAVKEKKLKIVSALYDLETGAVRFDDSL